MLMSIPMFRFVYVSGCMCVNVCVCVHACVREKESECSDKWGRMCLWKVNAYPSEEDSLAGCYNLVYINFVTPVAISAHSQTLSSFYTFLDPIYLKFLQVCWLIFTYFFFWFNFWLLFSMLLTTTCLFNSSTRNWQKSFSLLFSFFLITNYGSL